MRAPRQALLILVGLLSWSLPASTKPEFPERLRQRLPIDGCVPSCLVCHSDPLGGADKLHGFWPVVFPIVAEEAPPAQLPALDGDFDQDGASDGDELRRGESPVIAGDASICTSNSPQYGCGARIARFSPEGPTRAGLLLFGGFWLGALIRRTTRRRVRR